MNSSAYTMNATKKQHGFWRPIIRHAVDQYLDCGDLRCGFARIRCSCCRKDFLLAFSRTVAICAWNLRADGAALDPLVCPHCGRPLKIISSIEQPAVVRKILEHLKLWDVAQRSPPESRTRETSYDPESFPGPGN